MKQITQKELIDLIREKQENAINAYKFVAQQLSTQEEMFAKALKEERNKAYINAYEDLICYLDSVEIVPDRIEANKGQFVGGNEPTTLCDKCIMLDNCASAPYRKKNGLDTKSCEYFNDSKIKETKPSVFARIRAFYDEDSCIYIDPKEIVGIIEYRTSRRIIIFTANDTRFGFDKKGLNIEEIVEWWRYWKQN